LLEIADFLHELVVLIKYLNVSAFNLFSVESGLSILGNSFVLENNECRTSSSTVEFFNEDVSFLE